MNRNLQQYFYHVVYGVIGSILVLCLNYPVIAEQEHNSRVFPKTKQEFIEALDLTSEYKILHLKGPKGIVDDLGDDYGKLQQFPMGGVLVHFAVDSAKLPKESQVILRRFAEAIQEYPKTFFVIAGHTDWDGTNAYNEILSERRSQAVFDFLVSEYRIEGTRLFIKGYGEEHPIASNGTEEGKTLNRRVEFARIR